jgi:hypothetical protein
MAGCFTRLCEILFIFFFPKTVEEDKKYSAEVKIEMDILSVQIESLGKKIQQDAKHTRMEL